MRFARQATRTASARRALLTIPLCATIAIASSSAFADSAADQATEIADASSVPTPASVDEFARLMLPRLRAVPEYAGVYVEPTGEIVVTHVGPGTALATILNDLPANASSSVTLRQVLHSEDALIEEAKRVHKLWLDTFDSSYSVIAVDLRAQTVRLGVEARYVEQARDFAERVAREVELDVGVESLPQEAVCTSRSNCYSPFRPGIVIRKGSTTGSYATMGFHVLVGSSRQFVTSGHAGYSGSDLWYHAGYGLIGAEQANIYTAGYDGMRVAMPSSQVSTVPYGSSTSVTSVRPPIQGETVCVSRGVTGSNACSATVSTTWTSWLGSTCQCTQYGADINGASIVGGDSGSPIWSGSSALGIVSTTGGAFARMWDLEGGLGFQILA